MANKKTGLGRGLDALLGDHAADPAQPATAPLGATAGTPVPSVPVTPTASPSAPSQRSLGLDQLKPGVYQPRRDMHRDTLKELADSIQEQGVLSPITVRALAVPDGNVKYEIIAGERRWRASQIAGLKEIPVVVRDVDDEQAAAIALIENLQREDLNPLEEAEGLRRLIDEFDLTHQDAARAVGKSRAAVTNLIRLLDLAPDALQLLAAGELSMGHARALLALSGNNSQTGAAREVVARGLSVRQTEVLVKRLQSGAAADGSGGTGSKGSSARGLDPDIRRLQDDLREKLGASVQIQHSAKGKGKLIISYNSVDELDGILSHIK